MSSVLLATCTALPSGDEDADLLTNALCRLGVASRWVSWTDPNVRWDDALVVLRSTWDYTHDRAPFLEWINTVARLANDADVIARNTDKTYLRDLAAAGVPTVASTFAAPGEPAELPAVEFVVQPSVGAGSRGASRFTPDRADAARVHVDEIIEARTATGAELEVADAALAMVHARFGRDQLYARVDLLLGPDAPVVTELELTEPSLFLLYDGHDVGRKSATDRFATAIADRA